MISIWSFFAKKLQILFFLLEFSQDNIFFLQVFKDDNICYEYFYLEIWAFDEYKFLHEAYFEFSPFNPFNLHQKIEAVFTSVLGSFSTKIGLRSWNLTDTEPEPF